MNVLKRMILTTVGRLTLRVLVMVIGYREPFPKETRTEHEPRQQNRN